MSSRRCSQCNGYFEARLPGSGLKASLCSVVCERAEKEAKARKAASRKQARQQRTRQGVDGEERGWPLTVFDLYGTDCLSCGGDAQEAHHITARSHIMNAAHLSPAQRQALEFDPVNGMPVCRQCHERATNGTERFYFSMIPGPAVDWCIANGFTSRVFDDNIYLGAPIPLTPDEWSQHIEGEAAA